MNENEKWHRHLGAYGICVQDGKLLVIRKVGGPYTGRYDLPGGTIEARETIADALRREFLEEAGIRIQIARNVGACDYVIPYELPKRGTTHIHHVAVFYEVRYDGGELASSPDRFEGQDSIGALWIPIAECTVEIASPLVLQAVEWMRNGQVGTEAKRLDDWIVK